MVTVKPAYCWIKVLELITKGRLLVTLYTNGTFRDIQVGWLRQVTLSNSNPIRQVSLYCVCWIIQRDQDGYINNKPRHSKLFRLDEEL